MARARLTSNGPRKQPPTDRLTLTPPEPLAEFLPAPEPPWEEPPPPAKKKNGHPPAFDPRARDMLLRLVRLGLSERSASEAVGVDPKRLFELKGRDPIFAAQIRQARGHAKGFVAGALMQFVRGRNTAGSPVPPQVQLNAILFWLSRRAEEFQERAAVEVTEVAERDESYL